MNEPRGRVHREPDLPITHAASRAMDTVVEELGDEWLAAHDGIVIVIIRTDLPGPESCAVAATRADRPAEIVDVITALTLELRESLRAIGKDVVIAPLQGNPRDQ